MKTTLDLPSDLVREMKLQAAREGRKLRDVATEIFRRGLSQPISRGTAALHRVKLPLIACKTPASPVKELTSDQLAEVLLKQEVVWSYEAAGR